MTKMAMPQLHVGRGLSYGPSGVVTVFPVWSAETPIRGLATGAHAKLEVGEDPEGPVVEMLSIHNRGVQPALLLEGELFEGGWQTRALVRDAILPTGGPYPVEVACVEQHRWGGGVGHHRRARRSTVRVQMSLRANNSERQARVWSDVERYQSVRRVPTASLADQLEEASHERGTMDPPIRPLAGQCGALIGIGGQPLVLELFGSPAALAAHLMPMVETAIFEALSANVGEPVPSRRARRMLAQLDNVELWVDDVDERGIAVRMDTPRAQIRGVALPDRWIAAPEHSEHQAPTPGGELMKLTTAQHDRASGVLLGTAAGDALGAPYEFQPPRGPELAVVMEGGGGWELGEWTDDTAMAIAIAEVAATGADLRDEEAQDTIVRRWVEWAKTAKDVGIQTRDVLAAIGSSRPAASAREYAARRFAAGAKSAGNGSLMRTAPVALAYLVQGGRAGEEATVEAAIAISDLTHGDPDCADACVLWCLAIRHAVLTGELDIRRGLECLAADRRMLWSERLDEAERLRPQDFPSNGWVVGALQAAWSAIVGTPIPDDDAAGQVFRADHLRHGLDAAVRCGYDTDTVAAIAGGLLGALHGASAVPAEWRRKLHGWPGMRVRELDAVTTAILRGGQPDPFDYGYELKGDLSARAMHPLDDGLHLGAIGALRPLDADIDAVVSLCRVGNRDVDAIPVGTEHIEVRLVDQDGVDENPNLGFVLRGTVELLRSLRAEGKTVLLHCVQAQSRTPTVAALYGAAASNESAADVLARLELALPDVGPISTFRTVIESRR